MRVWAMTCAVLAAAALSGCHRIPAAEAPGEATDEPGFLGLGGKHGRYSAVGIYQPGESWSKLMADQRTQGDPAAQPLSDQAIIVLTDSQSGEVRACGDMTGYCVGMNPWKTALTGAHLAPIRLKAPVKPAAPADAAGSAGSAGSAASGSTAP